MYNFLEIPYAHMSPYGCPYAPQKCFIYPERAKISMPEYGNPYGPFLVLHCNILAQKHLQMLPRSWTTLSMSYKSIFNKVNTNGRQFHLECMQSARINETKSSIFKDQSTPCFLLIPH